VVYGGAVSRSDPQRILIAQWTGIRNRLHNEARVSEERASNVVDAWVAEAEHRGIRRDDYRYWDYAWDWLLEQR
jgi:hypothetical protein